MLPSHVKQVYARAPVPSHMNLACSLSDGLYQVTTPWFVAGFVVEERKIVNCAPILFKNLGRWTKQAVRLGD